MCCYCCAGRPSIHTETEPPSVPKLSEMVAFLAAAAKLRSWAPLRIPLRCCSDGPNSATSAVPPSVAKVFEDFVSYLKAPKGDLARAALINEEIGKVLKTAPPEIALVQIRGYAEELAQICDGSTIETRVTRIEVGHEYDRRFGFGVYTSFAALLVGIPFAIHTVSTTGKKERADTLVEVEGLRTRVNELERAMKSTTNGDATSNGGPHATDIDNDNDAKGLKGQKKTGDSQGLKGQKTGGASQGQKGSDEEMN